MSEPKPPFAIARAARKLQEQFLQNAAYKSLPQTEQSDILRRINMRAGVLAKAFFEVEFIRLTTDGSQSDKQSLFDLIDKNRGVDGYLPRLCTWRYLAEIHARARLLLGLDAK